MKINTTSVLTYKDKFIKNIEPETLDKMSFSNITDLAKYRKALEITEIERTNE